MPRIDDTVKGIAFNKKGTKECYEAKLKELEIIAGEKTYQENMIK